MYYLYLNFLNLNTLSIFFLIQYFALIRLWYAHFLLWYIYFYLYFDTIWKITLIHLFFLSTLIFLIILFFTWMPKYLNIFIFDFTKYSKFFSFNSRFHPCFDIKMRKKRNIFFTFIALILKIRKRRTKSFYEPSLL